MTGDVLRSVKFSKSYVGYSPRQVDDLLRHVASILDAGQSPAEVIADVRFDVVVRGYSIGEVDSFFQTLRDGPHELRPHRTVDRAQLRKILSRLGILSVAAVFTGALKLQDDASTRVNSWPLAIAESAAILVGFFGLIIVLTFVVLPILTRRQARLTPERRQDRERIHRIEIRGAALLLAPLLLWSGAHLAIPPWTDSNFNATSMICRSPVVSAWARSGPTSRPRVEQIPAPKRTVTLPNSVCSSHARVRLGIGTGLIVVGLLLTLFGLRPWLFRLDHTPPTSIQVGEPPYN